MPPSSLNAAIEALLFSSDQPLPIGLLTEALDVSPEAVLEGLHELGGAYQAREAGVELREIAGGWMLVTTAQQSEWVGRLLRGKRRMRLSRAALETMAIIAYKQPVTKSEVEAIRGVDSSGVLATLMERNLVTIRGRSKVVGRPLLYGTTQEFLEYFGLRDLAELPRPEELRALVAAREPEQLEMMELEVVSQVGADLAAAEAAGGIMVGHHEALPLEAEPPTADERADAELERREGTLNASLDIREDTLPGKREADEDGIIDDEVYDEVDDDAAARDDEDDDLDDDEDDADDDDDEDLDDDDDAGLDDDEDDDDLDDNDDDDGDDGDDEELVNEGRGGAGNGSVTPVVAGTTPPTRRR